MEFSDEKLRLAKEGIRQELEAKGFRAFRFISADFLHEGPFEDAKSEEASKEIKSIVVILFPYFTGETAGNMSLYCRGRDYHAVVPKLLKSAVEKARSILGEEAKAEAYADTGPLHDRYLVQRSFLAVRGQNQMMISPVYGSYFFCAYIALNAPLEPDPIPEWKRTEEEKYRVDCLRCGKCLEACPGGALQPDGSFRIERCLSAITQKTGELSEKEKEILLKGTTVFGCDICQTVCPMNAEACPTFIPDFAKERIDSLTLEDLEGLTRRSFKEKYPERAFTWRGPEVIRRNLRIKNGD